MDGKQLIISAIISIPIYPIVIALWTQLEKRKNYVENRTGNSIDKFKEQITSLYIENAIVKEKISWIEKKLNEK